MSLVIYKSSAGSGKTHTLVLEYLKITLENTESYRHILAITFTNKAAAEMKQRIITTLQELSEGKLISSMATTLLNKLHFSKTQLQQNATTLLANLIHHYEDFGVSTIDSFVHRVIRTFAADVNLPHGFEVVIDSDDIVPDIIEDLYFKLGDDKALTEVMVEFVLSLTDQEKSYNTEMPLIEFINKQTNEEGFEEIKKLSELEMTRFLEILKLISTKQNKLKALINKTAREALSLIETNGLEASAFRGGSKGIIAYFSKNTNKLATKTIAPSATIVKNVEADNWYGGKAKANDKATIDLIKEELITAFTLIRKKGKEYLLLKLVYNKLYAVALLKEIRQLFDDFTVRTNKVHISEFNKKISNSIAGQSTPFIYERLGVKYTHFLIDEFQDTSVLQWYNLFPLIENSLAAGHFNMLVGDAKQAIYRFRSGEVELFSSLPKLYGKPDLPNLEQREALLAQSMVEKHLTTNYRSYREIVDFNNRFFSLATDNDKTLLSTIYANHDQEVASGKQDGGYVSIDLIEAGKAEEYKKKRLETINGYVNTLQAKGFSYRDICVLTHNGSDAVEIASHLLTNNIPVISSESLLLTSSPEVRFIITVIKALLEPNNSVVLAELIETRLLIQHQSADFESVTLRFLSDSNTAVTNILQWAGIDLPLEILKQKPLFQLAEYLYNSIAQTNTPNIYFNYFLDFITEKEAIFENRLDAFLELWEKKKEKLYIIMPEGEDAIRIMTIHKAKGLKFQVVILDYQNRRTKLSKEEFWTDINIPGAPDLAKTLLPLSKEPLAALGLNKIYDHEWEKTRMDFLNLAYVAFTRPVEALFMVCEAESSKEKFSKEVISFLKAAEIFDDNKLHYEFGELKKLDPPETLQQKNITLSQWISNGGDFPVQVASAEEVYWALTGEASHRARGKLVHEILSAIRTTKDIERAVNLFLAKGVIDNMEAQQLSISIREVTKHPALKAYFSDEVIVKNETEILVADGEIVRPDRVVINHDEVVVIDYKTGEKEKKHIVQINGYKQAFYQLGYKTVKGILVYLGNKVELIEI
ncbi:MAG: hypothetical protein DRJ09_00900 [Bacteroidetes bacterium]|nr:MAG: hypothetical protein DRJ09_00900 [Bacteroidota bacterium]